MSVTGRELVICRSAKTASGRSPVAESGKHSRFRAAAGGGWQSGVICRCPGGNDAASRGTPGSDRSADGISGFKLGCVDGSSGDEERDYVVCCVATQALTFTDTSFLL